MKKNSTPTAKAASDSDAGFDGLTIRQAAKQFDNPRSRIARAISRGLFESTKVKNRRVFTEEAIKAAMVRARSVERNGCRFTIRDTRDLVVSDRHTERFATIAAADEFAAMLARSK